MRRSPIAFLLLLFLNLPAQPAAAIHGSWTTVSADESPGRRYHHVAVHDAERDRMIVYGGYTFGSAGTLETWALDLGTGVWSQIPASGPPSMVGHSAIVDPVRDRMILYAGTELWSLDLAGSPAWNVLATTGGTPPAHAGHSTVYDPVHDRMIVFGGDGTSDVWQLSLAGEIPEWSLLPTTGVIPSPRFGHVAVYDSRRQRMVVFGNGDGAPGSSLVSLTLDQPSTATWAHIEATGPEHYPSGRVGIYDPVRDRIVFQGGGPIYQDGLTSSLLLSGTPHWTTLSTGGQIITRTAHAGIYDSARDRLVVSGGVYHGGMTSTYYYSAHALWFPGPTSVDLDPAVTSSRISAVIPNPARGSQAFVLGIVEGKPVSAIEVFSVTGQRIWSRDLSSFTAGSHRVVWDGLDHSGSAAAPGVYFAQMTGAAGQRSGTRFVRME